MWFFKKFNSSCMGKVFTFAFNGLLETDILPRKPAKFKGCMEKTGAGKTCTPLYKC
jgi:hypothetical protein